MAWTTEGNEFEILEHVCASALGHDYLLLQAKDQQSGEIVWAVGDDQVCAITREDFIQNRAFQYNDVCIQEFPYQDYAPESVGRWKPLIEELVKATLRTYMEQEGLVHVYPQWLPGDLHVSMGKDVYQELLPGTDHIILYNDNTLEFVPRVSGPMTGPEM